MPYLSPENRERIDQIEDFEWIGVALETGGELNYVISRLLKGFLGASPRYARMNEAMGALECAKQEWYARVVRPYEDTKRQENGDVY